MMMKEKCIEQFKQCLALIVPSLRLPNLQSNTATSGYHDPNNPNKAASSPKNKSQKKKNYQRLENPGSVSAFCIENQIQDEEEDEEEDDLEIADPNNSSKRRNVNNNSDETTGTSTDGDSQQFFNEFSSWRTDQSIK